MNLNNGSICIYYNIFLWLFVSLSKCIANAYSKDRIYTASSQGTREPMALNKTHSVVTASPQRVL